MFRVLRSLYISSHQNIRYIIGFKLLYTLNFKQWDWDLVKIYWISVDKAPLIFSVVLYWLKFIEFLLNLRETYCFNHSSNVFIWHLAVIIFGPLVIMSHSRIFRSHSRIIFWFRFSKYETKGLYWDEGAVKRMNHAGEAGTVCFAVTFVLVLFRYVNWHHNWNLSKPVTYFPISGKGRLQHSVS